MKQRTLARYMVGVAFVVILVALFLAGNNEEAEQFVGANGIATYRVDSNPILLVVSTGLIALYIWVLRFPIEQSRSFKVAGLWRRFFAFVTDYLFSVLIVVPWTGFIALLIEASRNGHFAWAVQREALPQDGWISIVLMLVDLFALLVYFALPLKFMSTSPGSALFGISVLNDTGKGPSSLIAFSRPVVGFLALCLWPLSIPLALSNSDKKMWQDIRCGTHVVRWTD